MDSNLTLVLTFVSGGVIIILVSFLIWYNKSGKANENEGQRRAGGPRARARLRAAAAQQHQREDSEEDPDQEKEKIGAKKRAKLEAKAERKAQREIEEREREDKKKKKEQAEEERRKQEEREKEEEKRQEEIEKREEEERLKKEHEEYLKLKSAFSVEEEGYGDIDIGTNANLLLDFVTYIEDMKVVTFEDLAAKFSMKTQSVIDRVQDLQKQGRLTGVVDDRGKFIYISQKELESVAKFVKQRGRVSLIELVENSHRLVNLVPNVKVEN